MCEYCREEEFILSGTISSFNDMCLFGMKEEDTITFKELVRAFEKDRVRVFYDRGHLRLTTGDDIGCLDHSLDKIAINYCPMCGEKLH